MSFSIFCLEEDSNLHALSVPISMSFASGIPDFTRFVIWIHFVLFQVFLTKIDWHFSMKETGLILHENCWYVLYT